MMSLEEMQSETKYEKEDPTTSDSCEDMYGGHLMPFVIHSYQVPSEEQYLEIAIRSLPKGLSIRPTTVPGGQYGIWSDSFIPKGIKFGPYEPAADQLNLSHRDAYSSNDGLECSWFRFVNCAPSKDQMNLITTENGQKIYYCTSRQISCDEELLSWNDENSLQIATIKKEVEDFTEAMDVNNEERDTSRLSSCDESTPVRMSTAIASIYQFSDRGARDTGDKCHDSSVYEEYVLSNTPPLEMQAPSDVHTADGELALTWTNKSILLLLRCLEKRKLDLRNPKIKKKDVWKSIKDEMVMYGFKNINEAMVERKFRNMKGTYKTIKDNKKSTGKGEVKWAYYEAMGSLFENDKTINVGHTVSSSHTEIMSAATSTKITSSSDVVVADSLLGDLVTAGDNAEGLPLGKPCTSATSALTTPAELTLKSTEKKQKIDRAKRLYALRKRQVEIEELQVKELQLLREAMQENNRIQAERNALWKEFLEKKECFFKEL